VAISAFGNRSILPWKLYNRWINCLLCNLQVIHSHIYRKWVCRWASKQVWEMLLVANMLSRKDPEHYHCSQFYF